MSGRRVRAAVKAAIDAKTGTTDSVVVIAGLSNSYVLLLASSLLSSPAYNVLVVDLLL